jgi:hypothetical protein
MTGPQDPASLVAVLVELDRVRGLLLAELERRAPRPPEPPDTGGAEQALYDLLADAQRAVLGHPAAARQVRDLLIAQGRRYAETAEGGQLRDALVASEAVGQLRRVWEAVSLNALDGPTALSGVPDAWVELLVDAATGASIDESVLARLRPDGVR